MMADTATLPEALFQVGRKWLMLDAAEASTLYAVPVYAVERAIRQQGLVVTVPTAWRAVTC